MTMFSSEEKLCDHAENDQSKNHDQSKSWRHHTRRDPNPSSALFERTFDESKFVSSCPIWTRVPSRGFFWWVDTTDHILHHFHCLRHPHHCTTESKRFQQLEKQIRSIWTLQTRNKTDKMIASVIAWFAVRIKDCFKQLSCSWKEAIERARLTVKFEEQHVAANFSANDRLIGAWSIAARPHIPWFRIPWQVGYFPVNVLERILAHIVGHNVTNLQFPCNGCSACFFIMVSVLVSAHWEHHNQRNNTWSEPYAILGFSSLKPHEVLSCARLSCNLFSVRHTDPRSVWRSTLLTFFRLISFLWSMNALSQNQTVNITVNVQSDVLPSHRPCHTTRCFIPKSLIRYHQQMALVRHPSTLCATKNCDVLKNTHLQQLWTSQKKPRTSLVLDSFVLWKIEFSQQGTRQGRKNTK